MPRELEFRDPGALLARAVEVRASRDEVHIWPVRLEGSEAARAQCEALLSSSEIERARRFHFEHLRTAFIFAHGLLRHVLAAYAGVDAASLEFTPSEFGKPALVGPGDSSAISFNLSHSHGRALLAVSTDRDVGVDIEQENARTDVLGIASSYFFGSERDAIVGRGVLVVTERRVGRGLHPDPGVLVGGEEQAHLVVAVGPGVQPDERVPVLRGDRNPLVAQRIRVLRGRAGANGREVLYDEPTAHASLDELVERWAPRHRRERDAVATEAVVLLA